MMVLEALAVAATLILVLFSGWVLADLGREDEPTDGQETPPLTELTGAVAGVAPILRLIDAPDEIAS